MRCRRTFIAWVFLSAIACGRTNITPDEGVPTDDDVVTDDGPVVAHEAQLCGVPRSEQVWSTPELMTDVYDLMQEVNVHAAFEMFDPTLSEDGLTLYTTSDNSGPWLVHMITRAALDAPFTGYAVASSNVNVQGSIAYGYNVLASKNVAVTAANYPAEGVPAGSYIIAITDTSRTPFVWVQVPASRGFASVIDPRLSEDGLTLVFAVTVEGSRRIFESRRSSLTASFLNASALTELPAGDNSAPWLSRDKRVLVFVHAGPDGNQDIWMADRSDTSEPFANAAPIAALNSTYVDGEPFVREGADGCELLMITRRPDNAGFFPYRSLLGR
jgi:hypothetical protein